MRNKILILSIFLISIVWSKDNSNSKYENLWWRDFSDSTLNKIIDSTITNNKQLESVRKKSEQARAQSKIIRSQLMPIISANGRWNTTDINGYSMGGAPGTPLPNQINSGSVTLDAQYKLDSWGEELQQYRSAKLQALAAEANFNDLELNTIIKVTTLYLDVIFTKNQLEILGVQKKTAQDLLKITESLYKTGQSSGLILLQQQQQLASVEASIPPAELQYQNSLEYLAAVSFMEVNTLKSSIVGNLPDLKEIDTSLLSINNRPDIIAAQLNEKSAKANFSKTKLVLIPTVSVNGSVGYDYSDPGTSQWEDKWQVGAQVSVPLFTGGAIASGFVEGRSNYQSAKASNEQVNSDAKAQLQNAITEENSYRAQVEAYSKQFKSASSLYNESLKRYRLGETSFLDVLAAINTKQMTEITLLRSRRNLIKARLNIIKAAGGNITATKGDK